MDTVRIKRIQNKNAFRGKGEVKSNDEYANKRENKCVLFENKMK